MPTVALQDATPDDAATIVRILIETKTTSWPGAPDPHDLDVDFWHERWRNYIEHGSRAQKAKGDGFCLIAMVDAEAVGFAAYHHTRRFDCDAELESIYILPAFQARGIGTTMLREIVRRLQADGSRSMCVGYSPDNPYKRFYAKHGAEEINPHWAVWRSIDDL